MNTPKNTLSLELQEGYDSDGNMSCPGTPKKKRLSRNEHFLSRLKCLEEDFHNSVSVSPDRPLNKNVMDLLAYQRKLSEENARLKSTINYYEGMVVLLSFLVIFNYI